MSEVTCHLWGFFDDGDQQRPVSGVAISTETVYGAFQRLRRHIQHFDGEICDLRSTRPIDGGSPVEIEFTTPARGRSARMWHRVVRESNSWPDFTVPADPTETEPEEGQQ